MNAAQKYLLDCGLDDILLNPKDAPEFWHYTSDLMIAYAEKQVKNNVAKSNVIESSKCKHCGADTSFGATVCYGCACVRNA